MKYFFYIQVQLCIDYFTKRNLRQGFSSNTSLKPIVFTYKNVITIIICKNISSKL